MQVPAKNGRRKNSMALDTYQAFWSQKAPKHDRAISQMRELRPDGKTWGGAGDPLGAQTPAVQEHMLQQLARRATGENGRIDDWMSLVSPKESYGENVATILSSGGKDIDSNIRDERDEILEAAGEMAVDHARDALCDNFEAIESGEASELVDDITAEFGELFVREVLEQEREHREPDESAPLPDPDTKPAPETPVEAPKPQVPDAETAVSADQSAETSEKATFNPVPELRDYSGALGFCRLLVDMVRIPVYVDYYKTIYEVNDD